MLTLEEQDALTSELADQPRHETVRMLLRRLLAKGLGADSRDIDLMEPVPEVHGRVGALLGRTVFEWKFDLMRDRSRPGGQNKTDESRQNGRNLGVGSFIKGSIYLILTAIAGSGGRVGPCGIRPLRRRSDVVTKAFFPGLVPLVVSLIEGSLRARNCG